MKTLRALGWLMAGGGSALAAAVLFVVQPVGAGRAWGPVVSPVPARLEKHVRMLAGTFHPRGHLNIDGLDRTAGYVRAELEDLRLAATEQTYVLEGRTYRNVRARLGSAAGPLVVVGAHYDTADGKPGADDNASGVAGLLELARLLVAHPPRGPVELVAWTLEEPPHFRTADMGSARHARALVADGVPVRAAISVEMIGFFYDAPGSQHYPFPLMDWLWGDRADFVAVVADTAQVGLVREVKAALRGAMTVPVVSINAPRLVPGIDFSDHLNYWAAGFPALMVTDTSFNRNDHYHEDTDLPETLDYSRMADVVKGLFSAVHALAGG